MPANPCPPPPFRAPHTWNSHCKNRLGRLCIMPGNPYFQHRSLLTCIRLDLSVQQPGGRTKHYASQSLLSPIFTPTFPQSSPPHTRNSHRNSRVGSDPLKWFDPTIYTSIDPSTFDSASVARLPCRHSSTPLLGSRVLEASFIDVIAMT